MKEKQDNQKNKEHSEIKWFIKVSIMTFILSIIFSYISANGVSNLNLISAILILMLVIATGIFFDIVGVAVTVANEEEFHAKATKKVKGSKDSIKLIRNAPKVANICADVIGDICGVLSGAISALISVKISAAWLKVVIGTDLKAQGAENILSVYKGWHNKGYHGGLPIRSFNPESALSDGTSINQLLTQLDEEAIDLYLYHDGLRINMEEMGITRHKVMNKFNRRTYKEEVHGKVYQELNYLNPESTVNIMEDVRDDYLADGIEKLMISGISNTLFSYSQSGREYDRITTKNYYQPLIESYAADFNLLLEQPFAYLWDQTEAMMDMPTRSSNYVFVDEDIPFLALTLKGIVPIYAEYANFQANQEEFFLQMIEQGFNPSFLITHESPADLMNTNSSHIYSSEYERYEEMIQDYYGALSTVYNQTSGSVIVDYVREGSITKVSYENGVEVLVNYADHQQMIDGHPIEPMSYKVVSNE